MARDSNRTGVQLVGILCFLVCVFGALAVILVMIGMGDFAVWFFLMGWFGLALFSSLFAMDAL